MKNNNFEIGNIDVVLIAQRPKIVPYVKQMEVKIAQILKTEEKNINIKATTTEKLGFEGKEEGIACQSICVLEKY